MKNPLILINGLQGTGKTVLAQLLGFSRYKDFEVYNIFFCSNRSAREKEKQNKINSQININGLTLSLYENTDKFLFEEGTPEQNLEAMRNWESEGLFSFYAEKKVVQNSAAQIQGKTISYGVLNAHQQEFLGKQHIGVATCTPLGVRWITSEYKKWPNTQLVHLGVYATEEERAKRFELTGTSDTLRALSPYDFELTTKQGKDQVLKGSYFGLSIEDDVLGWDVSIKNRNPPVENIDIRGIELLINDQNYSTALHVEHIIETILEIYGQNQKTQFSCQDYFENDLDSICEKLFKEKFSELKKGTELFVDKEKVKNIQYLKRSVKNLVNVDLRVSIEDIIQRESKNQKTITLVISRNDSLPGESHDIDALKAYIQEMVGYHAEISYLDSANNVDPQQRKENETLIYHGFSGIRGDKIIIKFGSKKNSIKYLIPKYSDYSKRRDILSEIAKKSIEKVIVNWSPKKLERGHFVWCFDEKKNEDTWYTSEIPRMVNADSALIPLQAFFISEKPDFLLMAEKKAKEALKLIYYYFKSAKVELDDESDLCCLDCVSTNAISAAYSAHTDVMLAKGKIDETVKASVMSVIDYLIKSRQTTVVHNNQEFSFLSAYPINLVGKTVVNEKMEIILPSQSIRYYGNLLEKAVNFAGSENRKRYAKALEDHIEAILKINVSKNSNNRNVLAVQKNLNSEGKFEIKSDFVSDPKRQVYHLIPEIISALISFSSTLEKPAYLEKAEMFARQFLKECELYKYDLPFATDSPFKDSKASIKAVYALYKLSRSTSDNLLAKSSVDAYELLFENFLRKYVLTSEAPPITKGSCYSEKDKTDYCLSITDLYFLKVLNIFLHD